MWKRKSLFWTETERPMNFNEEYQKRTERIEEILKTYLPEAKGRQALIMEAMGYSLMAGGKRRHSTLRRSAAGISGAL